MPDITKLINKKDKILSLIKMKGPSLPVQIARGADTSPLFAGAFLSELFSEKKIKMSNMKVGSSPLYYIEGQEIMLERFVEHLNSREKDAFYLLQKEKLLEDSAQTPVVRVALRSIKDFAVPLRARIDEDIKIFWKYFALSDLEIKDLMYQRMNLSREEKQAEQEKTLEKAVEKKMESVKEDSSEDVEEEIDGEEGKTGNVGEAGVAEEKQEVKEKVKKEKKMLENEFGKKVKLHIGNKEIELLEVYLDRKKEFAARARIDILFGKQEFYIWAKDKKIVNDSDLAGALQKAQAVKLPALFMSSGELHKKAKEYLIEWGNLVRFEKLS